MEPAPKRHKLGSLDVASSVVASASLDAAAKMPAAPNMAMPSAAVQLRDEGWCVVPMFSAHEVVGIRERFWEAVASFPEYLPSVSTDNIEQHFVQGGFGALGNPASFHNPFVREWRLRALVAVIEQGTFAAILEEHPAGSPHVCLEQVVDRMMVRRPSKRASAESWHRDEAVSCLADDVIFGGWINFDPHTQVLSAVPRSHAGVSGHKGFAKLRAEEAAAASAQRQKLGVPPGHMLVFNEKLMHEVNPAAPATATHTILRLFTGWRLTTSREPQHGRGALEAALAQQSVCRLKSGQGPKMWANMSWSQPKQRQALEAWSRATFCSQCLHARSVKASKAPSEKAAERAVDGAAERAVDGAVAQVAHATVDEAEAEKEARGPIRADGLMAEATLSRPAPSPPLAAERPQQETRTMVHQQMASLEAYGLPLYHEYSEMERQLHYPRRSWTVQLPGTEEARVLVLQPLHRST